MILHDSLESKQMFLNVKMFETRLSFYKFVIENLFSFDSDKALENMTVICHYCVLIKSSFAKQNSRSHLKGISSKWTEQI